MIPELRDLSSEERLRECGLITLETRGDQIEVFRILNEYENSDRNMFFSLKKDIRTRGHEVTSVKGSVWIGYQEVLVLTEENKLMEQIVYGLCKVLLAAGICLKTRLTHISGGRITHR